MKHKYAFIAFIGCISLILSFTGISDYSSKISDYAPLPTYSGGAGSGGLGDRTGSPLSSGTCTACHSGGAFNASLAIQVFDGATPITSYTAGDTYTVVYTVSGTSNVFGFQGGVLTNTNTAGGSFSSPSAGTQLVSISGNPYIEHLNASATGSFQSSWTAPAINTGTVNFYGIGLVANGNGGTSGDQVTTPVVVSLTETVPTTITYSNNPLCSNESNQTPQLTGITNGTYSSTIGLSIDANSGIVNIGTSTPGTYSITYNYGSGTTTTNLTINPIYTSSFTTTICDNETFIFGTQTLDASNIGLNTEIFQTINGCDSIVELTLIVLPTIEENISATICSGDTYTFNGQILNASNVGLNTAVLQSINGCDSIVNLTLTVETIDVAVTLTGTVLTANQTGSTYQWVTCPSMSAITDETNQTFTATSNGEYAVIITNNGCSMTSACYAITEVGVGILENNFGDQILLYPNPTYDDCSINLGNIYQMTTVSIRDLSGKLISSNTYNDSQLLTLKLTEPAGVYIVMIQSENKKAIIKLIKK
jgi:hypothetical protein